MTASTWAFFMAGSMGSPTGGLFFSFSETLLMPAVSSRAPPVELGPLARLAVDAERALRAGRVRAREDPVLPRGEAPEDLHIERFGSDEAEARLHARQRVRAHRRALLDGESDLVVPVDLVGGERHQAGR